MDKCALCGDDTTTSNLEDTMNDHSYGLMIRDQARNLFTKFGFKKSDHFCLVCFWK